MRAIDKRFSGVPALAGRLARGRAGRGACAGRPERRRQVDADQDPDRRLPQGLRGEIRFDGRPIEFASPQAAQRGGISTIYQEINLIPYRSVAENIFLGREPRRFGLLDWGRMNREAAELLRRFDSRRSTSAGRCCDFNTAIQQMVAIARAVSFEAKLVIMDEPTSSLDEREVAVLFDVIRAAQARRRLGDLRQPPARRALRRLRPRDRHARRAHGAGGRDGRHRQARAGRGDARPRSRARCAQQAPPPFTSGAIAAAAELLEPSICGSAVECDDAQPRGARGRDRRAGRAARLGPHRGGPGRLRRRSRRWRHDRGRRPAGLARSSPRTRSRAGSATAPEDRKVEGIVPDMSVRENLTLALLPRLAGCGIVDETRQREDRRALHQAPRHQARRARAEDPRAVRRQPAEGAAGALALHEPANS